MSVSDSLNYDKLKAKVLKAYELVPEAYRQKFRSCSKSESMSYVEFAHEKEQLFDKWVTSKGIGEEYGKLRELLLVEEFKRHIHKDIQTHLNEAKINTLHEAATSADDYALTHKLTPGEIKP